VNCEDSVSSRTDNVELEKGESDSVVVESHSHGKGLLQSEVSTPTTSESHVLHVTMDISTFKSRCLSASEESKGVVTCDSHGQFTPMQCILQSEPSIPPTCFCVNEAGMERNLTFPQGTTTCPKVSIEKVEISLNFPVWDDISSVQLGVEMQDFLRSMDAHLEEEKVEVEILPGSTNLRFVLLGENKVDVSYFFEQMVKRNVIGVEDQGKIYPADSSTSKFHYIASSEPQVIEDKVLSEVDLNDIPVDDQWRKEGETDETNEVSDAVSAESLALDQEYNIVAVLLTLVAAISAGLVVVGLFLAMQKKKSTGSYPKKPFESLAFSSQVYELEKKVPKHLPNFKVTPFVNKYKSTDTETSDSQSKA